MEAEYIGAVGSIKVLVFAMVRAVGWTRERAGAKMN
jgi:hypothetical protein